MSSPSSETASIDAIFARASFFWLDFSITDSVDSSASVAAIISPSLTSAPEAITGLVSLSLNSGFGAMPGSSALTSDNRHVAIRR